MASVMNNYAMDALNVVDWTSGDYRVLLTTSGYVPDKDHHYVSQVTNELSGGNYGRKILDGKTRTVDIASDRARFNANDVTWMALQAVAGTPKYAVIYLYNALDASAIIVATVSFWTTVAPSGGDWTVQWPADYIFYSQQ